MSFRLAFTGIVCEGCQKHSLNSATVSVSFTLRGFRPNINNHNSQVRHFKCYRCRSVTYWWAILRFVCIGNSRTLHFTNGPVKWYFSTRKKPLKPFLIRAKFIFNTPLVNFHHRSNLFGPESVWEVFFPQKTFLSSLDLLPKSRLTDPVENNYFLSSILFYT